MSRWIRTGDARCSSRLGLIALVVWLAAPFASAHRAVDVRLAAINKRIAAAPGEVDLLLSRAQIQRERRSWPKALADLRRASELSAGDRLALAAIDQVRGRLLLESDQAPQALAALDRAIATRPADPESRIVRGQVLARLGRFEAAGDEFSRGLALFGAEQRPSPQDYVDRARAYRAAGPAYLPIALQGLDEGLARLGPMIALDEEAVAIELELGNWAGAVARLDAITSRMQRRESWLARRAAVLERAGNRAEARASWAAALAAIGELPDTRRSAPAVTRLEAEIRSALARLGPEPSPGPVPAAGDPRP